jgi:AcrR family transcriptional regulator
VAPRRRLDDVRKPQILAAAVQLLVEEGLSHVRVADIAARAETSATSVIYYFGTKAELFEQAIAGADDAFYGQLASDIPLLASGVDRLALLVIRSSSSDWLLWMDLWVYARRNPELLEAHRRFDQRFRQMIGDTIRHGQARGEFGPVDAERASLRLSSLMRGLAVHVALGSLEYGPDEMIEESLHVAALELSCDEDALRAAAGRRRALEAA